MYLISVSPDDVVSSEYADRLKGLAESHIITKYTMQVILIQKPDPIHTILANKI